MRDVKKVTNMRAITLKAEGFSGTGVGGGEGVCSPSGAAGSAAASVSPCEKKQQQKIILKFW
jgi:hypothetical protein